MVRDLITTKGEENVGGDSSSSSSGGGYTWKQVLVLVFEFVASLVCLLIKLIVDMLHEMITRNKSGRKEEDVQEENLENDSDKQEEKQVAIPSKKERILAALAKDKNVSFYGDKLAEVKKLSEEEKVDYLLPAIIPAVYYLLDAPDRLNLRLVNQTLKSCVDSRWCSKLSHVTYLSTIYLTNLQKLSQFTKQMMPLESKDNSGPSLIPFVIVMGGLSPFDPYYCDWDDTYMDQLTCQVFWKAFIRSAQKIGSRITCLILDIRIDPSLGVSFAESITTLIVTEGLIHFPNLRYLVFVTNTITVEKSLSSVYSIRDPVLGRYPYFPKLECVEMLTLSEGHPSKSKFKTRSISFPSRFLRQHGETVKGFRIFGNLYDFKSMGVFQTPLLEWIHYDIHHCSCQGKEAELKVLLNLPVVEQEETPNLKEISVKVNWKWRTSDMSSFFKWLGRNYPQHDFEKISLKNSQHSWRQATGSQECHYSSQDLVYASSPQNCGRCLATKGSSAYGSDFPWLGVLQLPPIQSLEIWSEYDGSWLFLKGIRGNLQHLLLQRQQFFRNEDDMKEMFRRGLVKEIFAVEACLDGKGKQMQRIWDYFPKLKEVEVVWRAINYKNIDWDIERMMQSEEYKSKGLIKRMLWKITREEGLSF